MDQFILHQGDCLDVMRGMAENSVDAIVTDPPYHLTNNGGGPTSAGPHARAKAGAKRTGFMGKEWDGGDIAFNPEMWREAIRVLKPGGHLLAFSGSRTYHRMAVAIEDAGFEIRDQIMWLYGSGFPKSKNLGGDWQGWGTALKPAHEPICVARKPLVGTVAANVLEHGTGALNIDGCRVPGEKPDTTRGASSKASSMVGTLGAQGRILDDGNGRWPANVIHDGSDEVVGAFPDSKSCSTPSAARPEGSILKGARSHGAIYPGETGSAARFFYCAKASKSDRGEGNAHPTVKPTDLMRYLCRLVTPPGGLVVDPFTGSGSTGKAAKLEGFQFIGFELSEEYAAIARARMGAV